MNKAVLQRVKNRGAPPLSFIEELVRWGKMASPAVFAVNKRRDIYNLVEGNLGPWRGPAHRRAVMCEVLRVLAGFESSWKWNEDYDKSNPKENDDETKSAGIFQVSPNSRFLDDSLLSYAKIFKVNEPKAFRERMKTDHVFAFDYTARLLRVNTNHNGPVKRGEILPWLRADAVKAFETEMEDAV